VVAREEGEGDKRLVGYVTAQTGSAPDAQQLRQALAARLPEIMVPSVIVPVASLPLTPNGKVDRRALPSPHSAIIVPAAAPQSAVEKTIAAIWCEVLGIPSVGATANFFDLGGHSLLVVQVQRRLKEKLGREIAITDMFRFSTIQSLAGHLEGTTVNSATEQGLDRANARKAMLLRRQQGLLQTTPN
jgi:acyl carrier protein